MWIGLVVGALVGWWMGHWFGAIVLGFLGWLVGVIVDSRRAGKRPVAVGEAPAGGAQPAWSAAQRFERLERRLAMIESRLDRLERGAPLEGAAEAAPPQPEPAVAETPAQPAPIPPRAEPERSGPSPFPAAAPSTPNPLVAWITGGNAIARVGLLILFFGLAFLLKYAAERELLSPEARVGIVAAAGIALLVGGWRLRERRAGYALGLQGAGVAVLYLTTFAALRLYHLLPPEAAFVLLVAIVVLSAFIALAQDSAILAAFGAGGGFLAPILASSGAGSHVMLFSYYLVLNLGILAIALFRAWRGLNVMGFLFTFFIGLVWGLRFYQPDYFDSTEPFLGAFFVLYVAVAVLFARREAPRLAHYVDATLVFGTPLAAFGLQAALTKEMDFGLAWSCVAASAFYLALAALLRRGRESLAMLVEAFFALGVVFATLAIPLALDARWTAAAWALEGAAIAWFGIRQQRRLARAFGLALEVAAAFFYLDALHRFPAEVPIVDAPFLGGVLLAAAGIWTARMLERHRDRVTGFERALIPFAFLWGVGWWLFAALREIDAFTSYELRLSAHIGLLAATALASSALASWLAWPVAAWPALALMPAMALCVVTSAVSQPHPFARHGWLAWSFAIAVQAWVLRRNARGAPDGYASALHAGTVLVIAALGALELHWLAVEYTAYATAWSVAAAMVVPALLALAISSRAMDDRWPVAADARAYRVGALAPLVFALAMWVVYANLTHDGRSDPLPYLPILNALDLGHVLVGLAFAAAWLGVRRRPGEFARTFASKAGAWAAGALAFLWLNGVLLRSIHHWADVPYHFEPMMRSVLVQAALSISWTVLALALMVTATRIARRGVWMLGAALVGVVVVKLFVIDLSHVGGIERIVSFIGVGLLMLVVGWFAPVPPRRTEARS
ncbi:MAG TPA: DUF2339 domain-containing protein [Usitatibacter sp.]|nr:DUF2339 domain-containing protein [Usitatibacter sp.]